MLTEASAQALALPLVGKKAIGAKGLDGSTSAPLDELELEELELEALDELELEELDELEEELLDELVLEELLLVVAVVPPPQAVKKHTAAPSNKPIAKGFVVWLDDFCDMLSDSGAAINVVTKTKRQV